jgi:hypothetical protein
MKQKYSKNPEYGIRPYTKDQLALHKDISKLLTSTKYQKIPADDCMVVFGRIYSVYCISQLSKDKLIKINKRKK